jgi:hypothetical protein
MIVVVDVETIIAIISIDVVLAAIVVIVVVFVVVGGLLVAVIVAIVATGTSGGMSWRQILPPTSDTIPQVS